MPSLCAVESCKLVKQVGNDISFHKFPFHNKEIFDKWVNFVAQSESKRANNGIQSKKITKYSSICSNHFRSSDFSQAPTRRFLKKNAVPSIIKFPHDEEVEVPVEEAIEVNIEDPLSFCSLCRNISADMLIDDDLDLIRKCLPFTINTITLQKICGECRENLKMFSQFIDKITSSQQIYSSTYQPSFEDSQEISRIKLEPLTNIEEEVKFPNIQVIDFTKRLSSNVKIPGNAFTPQKKCEILEIVDIKPFHFDGSLQHDTEAGIHPGPDISMLQEPAETSLQQETYDEGNDIQILSPKQLKVELTDPDDDDGSNEYENIKNYIFISSIFLNDHNYVKNESGVKTECMENEEFYEDHRHSVTYRICNLCNKSFKTFKKYLLHKFNHQHTKFTSNQTFKNQKKDMDHKKIRNACSKIIKIRKQKLLKNEVKKPKTRKNKSYTCPTCSKAFSGPKNLYQHKISHSSSAYSCNICSKKFKRPHGLKQHIKSIHEKEKTHVCSICNYSYLLKADMQKCRHSKLKKIAKAQQRGTNKITVVADSKV